MKEKQIKLSDAERRGLEALANEAAKHKRYASTGRETLTFNDSAWHEINGATARRLESRGLAKSRAEMHGKPVKDEDLLSLISFWKSCYTITQAGLKAIGRKGKELK